MVNLIINNKNITMDSNISESRNGGTSDNAESINIDNFNFSQKLSKIFGRERSDLIGEEMMLCVTRVLSNLTWNYIQQVSKDKNNVFLKLICDSKYSGLFFINDLDNGKFNMCELRQIENSNINPTRKPNFRDKWYDLDQMIRDKIRFVVPTTTKYEINKIVYCASGKIDDYKSGNENGNGNGNGNSSSKYEHPVIIVDLRLSSGCSIM